MNFHLKIIYIVIKKIFIYIYVCINVEYRICFWISYPPQIQLLILIQVQDNYITSTPTSVSNISFPISNFHMEIFQLDLLMLLSSLLERKVSISTTYERETIIALAVIEEHLHQPSHITCSIFRVRSILYRKCNKAPERTAMEHIDNFQ